VAIVNVVIDHRGPTHTQRKAVVGHRTDRQFDDVTQILDGLDRQPSSDATDHRDAHHARLDVTLAALATHQLEPARDFLVTADVALALEHAQVVVDHECRGDAYTVADLADARRIASLVDVGLDVFENVLLSIKKLLYYHCPSPQAPHTPPH